MSELVVLVHKHGEMRTVLAERALSSPPRVELWWGQGAGMYTLDLVSNKLLRAPEWHAKNPKKVWLAWFEALQVKGEQT